MHLPIDQPHQFGSGFVVHLPAGSELDPVLSARLRYPVQGIHPVGPKVEYLKAGPVGPHKGRHNIDVALLDARVQVLPGAQANAVCFDRAPASSPAAIRPGSSRRSLAAKPCITTFREVQYLDNSVGRTGRLALAPLLPAGSRETWQLHL